MSEKYYTIFTQIGKAIVANAIATQTKVNFDKIVLGDSAGEHYEPTQMQTELKNKVWEGKVSSITIDKENPNWVVVEAAIPGNVGGFMIREAGILDDKGQLLVVSKCPISYKPKAEDGTIKDLIIRLIVEVANTKCVNFTINPTVILATQKDVQDMEKKLLGKDEKAKDSDKLDGKDSTYFAPAAHTHTKSQITNFAHTHTKSQITNFAHTHNIADINGLSGELNNLKQFAVDGKQTIINGINDSLGTNSGLTINNSWTDLDWWMKNKLKKQAKAVTIPFAEFSNYEGLHFGGDFSYDLTKTGLREFLWIVVPAGGYFYGNNEAPLNCLEKYDVYTNVGDKVNYSSARFEIYGRSAGSFHYEIKKFAENELIMWGDGDDAAYEYAKKGLQFTIIGY